MRLKRTLRTAITAISRNLLRSALTTLGIIIGIASVIVMMEIGAGSSQAIQKTISSMGANTILVDPGTAASGGVSFGSGTTMTLIAEDSDAIRREVSGVRSAAPIVRARSQVIYQDRNWVPQNIYGSTPEFVDVREWSHLAEGEMFTDMDVKKAAPVCLIGQTLVRELFPGRSPVGEEIRVGTVTLKVVGVLAGKGANMMGNDQDDILLAPWSTVKYRISAAGTSSTTPTPSTSESQNSNALYPASRASLYPESPASPTLLRRFENINQVLMAATDPDRIESVITQVRELLRTRHRLRPEDPDDFSIRNMAEMNKALSSTTVLMTRLLLGVALISLIVGGVGIMNIMLVSVTERTREIGLRMAVGAKRRDILEQFLVEAIVLCLAGGIFGVVLGRTISALVEIFLRWPVSPSIGAVVASFIVSVSVGVIFGYVPAARASKLDPIESLRYE